MARYRHTTLPPPYLKRIWLDWPSDVDAAIYPFNLPLWQRGRFALTFDAPITIIMGENGVGKSTLLEAIAILAGFDEGGGGPGYRAIDHNRTREAGSTALARTMKASWLPRIGQGWFFRAESFFSVARYLDEAGSPTADFLSHSHGEGFIRFFTERCSRPGIFLFDEPESALSPTRQFDFLKVLREMRTRGQSQAIIATHSPIIMAFPNARLLRMDRGGVEPIALEDTTQYRLLREFVLDPHGAVAAMLND